MTIPEASQLVPSWCHGDGGKCSFWTWVNQLKLSDLAKNMIRLSGFEPNEDIRIEFTGLSR